MGTGETGKQRFPGGFKSREVRNAYARAYTRARMRLIGRHEDEYQWLLDEEREKEGIPRVFKRYDK